MGLDVLYCHITQHKAPSPDAPTPIMSSRFLVLIRTNCNSFCVVFGAIGL